jgi:hypothetical protein
MTDDPNADEITTSDLPSEAPAESDTANAPGTGDDGEFAPDADTFVTPRDENTDTSDVTTDASEDFGPRAEVDDSIFDQGFLSEDAAYDAIGDADDSNLEVVAEGTAFKVVRKDNG